VNILVKNNELIRLKNGFYLITDRVSQEEGEAIPYEQIANLLYGPSYISLEWALSFFGLVYGEQVTCSLPCLASRSMATFSEQKLGS